MSQHSQHAKDYLDKAIRFVQAGGISDAIATTATAVLYLSAEVDDINQFRQEIKEILMSKVLVDQDQLTSLTDLTTSNKDKTDKAISLLSDLKQQITSLNANTPETVDLQPLLDKANAVGSELSGVEDVAAPPTDPAPVSTISGGAVTTDTPSLADLNPGAN